MSNNGRYRIDYFDAIRNANGVVLKTPARISQVNGRIEVSAEQFRAMTIPMRMAILLHEFSHIYLNDNVDDEVEADLNGLLIYLGLGYPRIEAFEVFAKTFMNNPTDENGMRFDRIKNFIDNFETYNTYLYD